MDKIFAKTLKTYLSPPSQADFFKNTGIKPFLLCDEKLYGQKKKKKEKTDDPEILYCRQMDKSIKPN